LFISELFELYSQCKDSAEVVQVQQEYLEKIQRYHEQKRLQRDDPLDLPSEESEFESDQESCASEYFDKFGNSITREEKEKLDQLLANVTL
jgi:hypothetical protein